MNALVRYYGAALITEKDKCNQGREAAWVRGRRLWCLHSNIGTSNHPTPPISVGTGLRASSSTRGQAEPSSTNPKEHIRNGQAKNKACGGRYKPTVRQVKRLRNRAVDEGRISKSESPGYLLECLTYNVPGSEFVPDDAKRMMRVVLYLKLADKTQFMSCDGIHTLFGTDPGGFSVAQAQRVIDALWAAY